MAGHNKWSKVKNIKGVADAKRSKVWTKIIREITVAARMGGIDPAGNPRLRKALEDARTNNLAKEPVQRAMAKASGKEDTGDYEELTYEGYGPAGVAILVSCLTDNRNRTYSEVRTAFNKNGGNLGTPGSVAFGFQKKGLILLAKVDNQNLNEDKILESGLEAGLEEFSDEEEGFSITCTPETLLDLRTALEAHQINIASADIAMVSDNPIELSMEHSETLSELIEALEDLDDVQKVWTSAK
ncbi:MAG: YebC/PmpR family DNA-binding transcriptional regulator [Myxococcota bacterium]